MALSVGRIIGLIELRDQFTSAIQRAAAEVERTKPKVADLQKQFENFGQAATKAGMTLSAAVTAPIVGIGALSVRSATEFQGAMNRLKAAVPTGDFTAMEAAANKWGAATVFSSTEAANAMVELGKAGLDSSQVIAALPSTLELATAGSMDLADAAALSANTMATFRLRAEDMGRANDVLAKAANLSTIDVRDLAESMKYVGPVAAQSKVSLESVSAAMAAMGDAGIKGSMSGTALRGILTTLQTPTDKQAALMEKLGLQTAFADGKMKPLTEILGMVEAAIKKTGNAGLVGADLMELFGDRAGPGMLALVNKGSEGLAKLEKDLNDAGYAGRVATAMMEGLPGALERMKGSLETAGVAIGQVLAPAISAAAGLIEKLANFVTNYLVPAFKALPGPVQTYIGLLLGIGAAIGPLLILFGSMASGLASLLPLIAAAGGGLATIGAGATTAAAGATTMTGATVALNGALLVSVARVTAIGGLISALIWAFPKAVEGAKNLSEALKSGNFSKITAQDTSNPLYWRNWVPGVERPNVPDTPPPGAGKRMADINLSAAPLIDPGGVARANGLADALAKANQEIKNMSAATRGELTAAIKSGAFSMDEMQKSSKLSETALKLFKDRIEEGTKASEKAATAQKKLTDEQNAFLDSITGMDKIKDATTLMLGLEQIEQRGITVRQLTAGAQEQINQKLGAALEVYKATGQVAPLAMAQIYAQTIQLPPAIDMASNAVEKLGQQVQLVNPYFDMLADKVRAVSGIQGSILPGQQLPMFQIPKGPGLFEQIFGSSKDFAGKLSGTIMAALQGGGNVGGSIGAMFGTELGKKGGELAGKHIGGMLGSVLGSVVPGLGTMLGGLLGSSMGKGISALMGKLFGGNDARKMFQDAFGDLDSLHTKLMTLGAEGEQMWIQITQKTGKHDTAAAAAMIDKIKAALDRATDAAKTTGAATEAAMEAANKVIGTNQALAVAQKAVSDLDSQIQSLYQSIEGEAPEEAMGVVEAQARARIAALEAERNKAAEVVKNLQQELIDATNHVADVLDQLPDKLRIEVEAIINAVASSEAPEEHAAGGVAGMGRLLRFRPRNIRDSVSAVLTPGEIILNAAQQDNVAAAIQRNPFAQGATLGTNPAVINVNMDGRTVTSVVVPHLADVIDVNVA